MSENSKIEWTDHTFNPWIGCTKVSPGCLHCYAETQDNFRKWTPEGWGKGKPRRRTAESNWNQVRKWNKFTGKLTCQGCGKVFAPMLRAAFDELEAAGGCPCTPGCGGHVAASRPRVFCASLADWLDDEVPVEWLKDLLCLIADCPALDFLLLTKRPENFAKRVAEVAEGWQSSCELAVWWNRGIEPANVWVGTTVEDQPRADQRIPQLLKIPARVRFLSCEPLLGPVTLTLSPDVMAGGYNALHPYRPPGCTAPEQPRIHWVICGGESGAGARPMHPDWARDLRDQCQAAGVPFLFKQWGEWCPATEAHGVTGHAMPESGTMPCGKPAAWIGWDGATACPSAKGLADPVMAIARMGKKAAGRELDGREWNEFPNNREVSA